MTEIQEGNALDPRSGAVTLAEYLREQWLPARELRGLKPTTLDNYRWICETYIIPRIGHLQLRKVGPRELVAFFEAFSKEVGRAGKRRSNRTIALTHRILSMALAHAVRAGVIARNPAEGARDDLPRGEPASKPEMWTQEELSRFLDVTAGDRLYPLWVLAVTTGMRRGEMSGLRWDDIDFEKGALRVKRARVMVREWPQRPHPRRPQATVRSVSTKRPWRSFGIINAVRTHSSSPVRRVSGKETATSSPTKWGVH